jgi:hypothetical protein
MREFSILLEKAENNPLLDVAGLVAAEDAQWNRDKRPQTTIKEPVAPAASPEIEAIDALVNLRLTKEVKAAVAALPYVSPSVIVAISKWSCFSALVPDELPGQIAELQRKYDDALGVALSYLPRAAGDAYRAHLVESEKVALETSSVQHCVGKSLEDFEVEFKHKFEMAMKVAKSFSPRASELIGPHISRFVSFIRELADNQAENERSRYELIGLPWVVSNFVAALYRAAETVEQHGGRGHSPKTCAQFLDLSSPKN